MSGFLPTWIANPLTNFFGHRIDFSNFGRTTQEKGLSFSSYSARQLWDRAFIWGGIIVGGAVGLFLEKQLLEEDGPFSIGLSIAAGTITGFLITHAKVSAARISHRQQLITNANDLNSDIEKLLPSYLDRFEENDRNTVKEAIQKLITNIMTYSLSDNQRSNATLTLLNRKTGFENLLSKINQDLDNINESETYLNAEFWEQKNIEILNHILNGDTVSLSETIPKNG